MRWRLNGLAPFLAAGLVACADDRGPTPPMVRPTNPPGPQARLYVFRPAHFVGGGATAVVKVNGQQVGALANGGTMTASIPTGDLTVSIGTMFYFGRLDVPLKAEAGKEYFVELTAQMPAVVVGLHGTAYFLPQDKSGGAKYCDGSWCAMLEPPDVGAKRMNGS